MNHMDTHYVLDIHTHTLASGHAYGTIAGINHQSTVVLDFLQQ